MRLSDFSLLKEDSDSYTIGHPKGRALAIPKRGLSNQAQSLISKLRREQHFADGTPDGVEAQDDAPDVSSSSEPDLQTEPVESADSGQVPNDAGLDISPVNASPELQGSAQAEPEMGMPAPAGAAQQAISDIQGGVAAEQKAGQEQAGILRDSANRAATGAIRMDVLNQDHNDADAKLLSQMHAIDPDRRNPFARNSSTGTKIGASIGILLSGIGSGITGQKNLALEGINNAINRDIDTQKNEQGRIMNLYHMNRQKYGDDVSAELATQNQMRIGTMAQLQAAQSQALGPLAKQRAANGIFELQRQNQVNNLMLAAVHGAPAGTEQQHVGMMDAMRMYNPKMADEMQKKYIPGVGVARIPIDQKNKDALAELDDFNSTLNEAEAFATNSDKAGQLGTFPHSPNDKEATAIKNKLVASQNRLLGLTRFTAEEKKLFEENIGSPGSFFKSGVRSQIGTLRTFAQQKQNSILSAHGVTPFQMSPQDAIIAQKARQALAANPNDPVAQKALRYATGGR